MFMCVVLSTILLSVLFMMLISRRGRDTGLYGTANGLLREDFPHMFPWFRLLAKSSTEQSIPLSISH